MKYLDETLRFEVNEKYPNKVIDYYSLSISDIENEIHITPVNKQRIEGEPFQTKTLESWFEVAEEIKYLKALNDCTRIVFIFGYEIVEEHYIKIYFKNYISNC